MAEPKCRKCGSSMVLKLNKKNGAYAGCSTPEKHTDEKPAEPEIIAIPADKPPAPPTEDTGFLSRFFR